MYNSILDKITPSSFQGVILSDAKETTLNLFVNAVAGSGKSATLQMIAELFYDKDSYEQDILACAFNSHIVKDLTPKMPPNTKVCTMHSLGSKLTSSRQGTFWLSSTI
jgi:superfamily I DNA/RNA helicase